VSSTDAAGCEAAWSKHLPRESEHRPLSTRSRYRPRAPGIDAWEVIRRRGGPPAWLHAVPHLGSNGKLYPHRSAYLLEVNAQPCSQAPPTAIPPNRSAMSALWCGSLKRASEPSAGSARSPALRKILVAGWHSDVSITVSRPRLTIHGLQKLGAEVSYSDRFSRPRSTSTGW
jgi:hypothetical protein